MNRTRILLLAGSAFWTSVVAAQEIRGVVRDSVTGLPIAGAVVVAMDTSGASLGRAITGEQGRYRIVRPGSASAVVVTRIGFRPRSIRLPSPAQPVTELDISMTSIPTFLQQVQVIAPAGACRPRPDAAKAAALYSQARAGLLSTVVAREANPATVTRLGFERVLDANGDRIVSQRVRVEHADRATVSFNAVRSSLDFTRSGFADDTGSQRLYFGPDADVLLDDAFGRAYCFRLDSAPPSRRGQVGLGFAPARSQKGRVDIDGTLWVDTVRRALSDIEFHYLGLDELSAGFQSGGTIGFREVSSGITLIDRWSLRLVGAIDSTVGDPSNLSLSRRYSVREVGGELARATWPDGRTWSASLGTLRLAARDARDAPAAGSTLALAGTDYVATTDTAGMIEISALVPGPYTAVLIDRRLAAIGISLPTDFSFTAVRDSTVTQRLTVPTAESFVEQACKSNGRVEPGAAWLFARVGTAEGRPVGGATWELAKGGPGGWIPVSTGGSTGAAGTLHFCRSLKVGETVRLQAWRGKEPRAVTTRRLGERLTIADLRLPTATAARNSGPQSMVDISGTVTDSATGGPVQEAFVTLVGVSALGITDGDGRFSISGVPRGEYTAEVRTNALDSLGVVGRTIVGVGTGAGNGTGPAASAAPPLRLYVPTRAQLLSAMCGVDLETAAKATSQGVVIGHLRLDGDAALPDARVVAEWTEGTGPQARTSWLRGVVDGTGTFRLCGVPTGVPLILRTQMGKDAAVGAKPVNAMVEQVRGFTRTDISLVPGLKIGGAFSGSVVSDSTDAPIADAEVVFPDLKRSVLTNAEGAFRVNDIPAGTHKVIVRRLGYGPLTADLAIAENETIEHRVVLGVATTALKTVEVTGGVGPNASFEANRKLGLGKFLTQAELEKNTGRKLGDVMATIPNVGSVAQAWSSHGWVVGKRVPPHLPPAGLQAGNCGPGACVSNLDLLREQGFYCPQPGEEIRGITCACYAQVYRDGRLQNTERPTEPFDINSVPPEQLAGVEWYASPAQTPSQYLTLNSSCGVLVLWTKTRGLHH